jgi:hypothetical protein
MSSQSLDEPADRDKFQHLIPTMLACIGTSLNEGDEASAQEGLEMFIEVAEAHPRFLRKQLPEVVQAVMQVRLDSARRYQSSVCAGHPLMSSASGLVRCR